MDHVIHDGLEEEKWIEWDEGNTIQTTVYYIDHLWNNKVVFVSKALEV